MSVVWLDWYMRWCYNMLMGFCVCEYLVIYGLCCGFLGYMIYGLCCGSVGYVRYGLCCGDHVYVMIYIYCDYVMSWYIYILWLHLRCDVHCDYVCVMIYLCDDNFVCFLWVWVDDGIIRWYDEFDCPVLSLCWVCMGLWVGWCVVLVELILSLGWNGVELDCPASSGCWK